MSTKDEISVINRSFSRALAGQDVDSLVDLYTDDARLLFHGMPMITGRSEITAMFRDDLAAGPVSIEFETIECFEDGSLVVDVGRYTTPKSEGKYVVVYRRQADGTLKLLVDAANSDGSPSP